jgi:hypothetical protein
LEPGYKNCTWDTGPNVIMIYTANQDMMLTKEELATEGNWNSVDDQNLKFSLKFKIQSFKTLKNFLEEEKDYKF